MYPEKPWDIGGTFRFARLSFEGPVHMSLFNHYLRNATSNVGSGHSRPFMIDMPPITHQTWKYTGPVSKKATQSSKGGKRREFFVAQPAVSLRPETMETARNPPGRHAQNWAWHVGFTVGLVKGNQD